LPQLEQFILDVKETLRGRRICHELLQYTKENHPDLLKIVKTLNWRVANKSDNHLCVEGGTGTGKSTLTLHMISVQQALKGKEFNLEKNTLFIPTENELSTRFAHLEPQEDYWVDEAIIALNKMKFFDSDVQNANQTAQTERYRGNTLYYCIPSFDELMIGFRKIVIHFRVWILPRHSGILRIKDIDPDMGFGDPWHVKENVAIKKQMGIRVTSLPEERLVAERKLPNYAADFTWADLSNLPDFMSYHLLYEALKKRSRVRSAIRLSNEKVLPAAQREMGLKKCWAKLSYAHKAATGMPLQEIYDGFGFREYISYTTFNVALRKAGGRSGNIRPPAETV